MRELAGRAVLCAVWASLLLASALRAEEPAATPASSGGMSAEELNRQLNNPVSSVWSLNFQSNITSMKNGGSTLLNEDGERIWSSGNSEWFYNLNFQPVIPLKLFTLFSSDARVQQDLEERGPKIRKLLKELRGLEEWGVRVVASGEVERSATSLRSGREYLETKKRLTNESASPSRATIRDAAAALKRLERLAAKVRKERFPPPGKGRAYVTGASFLVKTTRRGQWKKEIARLGAALADRGHRLDVSGPWPPYQFASR